MINQEQAVVELRQVSKRFGNYEAIKDLNLSIRRGEFFSIVGPSGCGKTTTLKMIAGFDHATEGAVYLSGTSANHIPPYKRNVNTVFQNYALFPHMTVYDNVAYPLKLRKVPKNEIRSRVIESLKMVSMDQFLDRSPNQLSGGQKQRVALARALISKPEVLLLDEPLSALDFHLRQEMQRVLKHLQREVDITFVYITHDQGEALSLSDRIAVMKNGVLHQVGSPEEIYEMPQTSFVAGFIGKSNLIKGRMEGPTRFVSDAGLQAMTNEASNLSGEPHVYISVRPEKLRISKDDERYVNRLSAVFVEETYYGADRELTFREAGGTHILMKQQKDDGNVKFSEGESVDLFFRPEDAVIVKEWRS
ncbi:ABC transporter ATP-binding protein [Paenibacillus durus]|uniref:Spermidine/putrescine import ATP-binding protein PotA n=1 Tax=Paenibacillus durus TaxID=44251 RepID=A0A089HUM4_PAEDU|nr:ABC transporter ATP-binding protein [Paenibacillus durus]AIQ14420.1 hypothetical protein PDUR_22835 [Paenibacillus durus]